MKKYTLQVLLILIVFCFVQQSFAQVRCTRYVAILFARPQSGANISLLDEPQHLFVLSLKKYQKNSLEWAQAENAFIDRPQFLRLLALEREVLERAYWNRETTEESLENVLLDWEKRFRLLGDEFNLKLRVAMNLKMREWNEGGQAFSRSIESGQSARDFVGEANAFATNLFDFSYVKGLQK